MTFQIKLGKEKLLLSVQVKPLYELWCDDLADGLGKQHSLGSLLLGD